ncbi:MULTISPECIES: hypothetical protein [Paraburkholderia]|uniref:Uncharacterized protein n=1 Tax=Paraburkholderia madseniana TaxID=2599607 RepID=A0AAP5F1M4_9BURK|nr:MULTISPECIES: hypothetical protein [Paraburkholderia]MCX4151686.1 hypothetical protein [Paraburkholderia madseniana]MCX4176961.1 hypothetical protein [Paraburkholderia madseniana]MDN7154614.1 hypothetical protein [Paraburkholderia sp. WS6]MDQ6413497.1 hypothetical protein [Paraburkholderia madseniana]MDQ6464951.1 hypothetical protein [Paraburkholderia madseniana]
MSEEKRGRGRPASLTPERRQEQLRAGKVAHRERVANVGKVRLDAAVEARSKAFLEAYRKQHGLRNLGAALDAILAEYMLTGKHK